VARRRGRVVRFHSNQVTVVDLEDGNRITLKLRGRFKMQGIRPLVGDIIEYTPDGFGSGLVENILHRRNQLTKPSVANVDQVMVVATIKEPETPLGILDRILVLAEKAGIEIVVVFNKVDILETKEEKKKFQEIKNIYARIYPTICTSAKKGTGLKEFKEFLKNKVSVMAGLSGVGKSSLLNAVNPGLKLRTGEVSRMGRGRHTTTYSELLEFDFGGFVADTPGFSSLEIKDISEEELKNYFPEFAEYQKCLFSDCLHLSEPGCAVRYAAEQGLIAPSRYRSYRDILKEIMEGGKERW